jgi:endonuclease YncB( thermonuclease family)
MPSETPTAAATETPTPTSTLSPTPTATPTPDPRFLVTRAIDGDTLELATGETVRLIGVNTPETVAPGQPVECYGHEASAFTKARAEGQLVTLEKDVSETDRFGRLLRYVWLPDGTMLNEVLVAEGYAQVSTFPPDVTYQERFLAAQQQAAAAGAGLWSGCAGPTPTEPPVNGDGCEPSYPTVCIDLYPPDLDCPQIPYRRFQVTPPDPHGFDGDFDGVGCESG